MWQATEGEIITVRAWVPSLVKGTVSDGFSVSRGWTWLVFSKVWLMKDIQYDNLKRERKELYLCVYVKTAKNILCSIFVYVISITSISQHHNNRFVKKQHANVFRISGYLRFSYYEYYGCWKDNEKLWENRKLKREIALNGYEQNYLWRGKFMWSRSLY